MPDDLSERDVLIWSEEQGSLLRRLASGERVNDAIDWGNVIEEIEDVGLSELNSVRSLLQQALIHLLKLASWAELPAAQWRVEVAVFLGDAQERFAPSMRQRIDVDALHGKALRWLARSGEIPLKDLPAECPFTLDELLADDGDIAALVARLQPAP